MVLTNHRLADAVTAELQARGTLKKLGIEAEEVASELKVSSSEFDIEETVFVDYAKKSTDGYRLLQELSGVDIYYELHVLDLLLRRGPDGKFAYEALSAQEIKNLSKPPFYTRFTKPIFSGKYIEGQSSEHLREFYWKP